MIPKPTINPTKYSFKAVLDAYCYFSEGIEQLLINAQKYSITLYDEKGALIKLHNAKTVEEKILMGDYVMIGKKDNHRIKMTINGSGQIYILGEPLDPPRYFADSQDLDITWYSIFFVHLCENIMIEQLYAGLTEFYEHPFF